jgi:hypothetical protein
MSIMTTIEKLVLAGQQAGFTVEQMIQILQTGASIHAPKEITSFLLECASRVHDEIFKERTSRSI